MLLNVSLLPKQWSCSQWQLIFAGERRQRSALAAYLNRISHQLTHQGSGTMTIPYPETKRSNTSFNTYHSQNLHYNNTLNISYYLLINYMV